MAVSTDVYFSNAIQGTPGIGADFNIFDIHTTPRYALGIMINRQDGNCYAYSHFGDTVTRGMVVSQDLSESSLVDTDNIVVAPASAQTVTDGTIGNKFIEITLASITADQYAGGYLVITAGTGIGYTYRIRGNTATGNPASGNLRLELYDKLQVALDATSDIAIHGAKHSNLEGATLTDFAVQGVACANFVDGEYGWIQNKGIAGILVAATIPVVNSTAILSATAGALVVQAAADVLTPVASCIIAGDAAGLGVFRLNL